MDKNKNKVSLKLAVNILALVGSAIWGINKFIYKTRKKTDAE